MWLSSRILVTEVRDDTVHLRSFELLGTDARVGRMIDSLTVSRFIRSLSLRYATVASWFPFARLCHFLMRLDLMEGERLCCMTPKDVHRMMAFCSLLIQSSSIPRIKETLGASLQLFLLTFRF
jgi:hypothetical protein